MRTFFSQTISGDVRPTAGRSLVPWFCYTRWPPPRRGWSLAERPAISGLLMASLVSFVVWLPG